MNRHLRKRTVKFALLAVMTTLLVICGFADIPGRFDPFSPTMGIAQTLNPEILEEAASLTLRGREQLAVGNAEAALATWQAAQTAYTRLDDSQGIAGSRVNQSLALQALGRSRGACGVLLAALAVEGKDWCDPFPEGDGEFPEFATSGVNAIGLRSLGDVLRSIGNLELSEAALTQSLQMAQALDSTPDIEAARLSWGNTQNAQYRRLRDLSDRTESTNDFDRALDRAKMALETYKTVGESLEVRAKLNRLSLLLDLHMGGKTATLDGEITLADRIISLLDELLTDPVLFNRQTPIESIYDRLHFARSLSQWQDLDRAIELTKVALEDAKNLGNLRAKAYALGILGELYEKQENFDLAREFTASATTIAQSIQAWDIEYQWLFQLGRIYQQTGETQKAIDFYQGAIDTLDRVRKNLLSVHSDFQFSFRDNVKPVYETTLDLLLRSPNPNNLERALEINQRFQLAELENFLGCDRLNVRLQDEWETTADAIVYIIVLEKFDRLIQVVRTSQNSTNNIFYHEARFSEVKSALNRFKNNLSEEELTEPISQEIIADYSRELYQLLIQPIRDRLPENGTLTFVLDSALQNITMAMLIDEDRQYLIEKYSIALSPFSQASQVNTLIPDGILIAGVGEDSPSFEKAQTQFNQQFNPLNFVDNELKKVLAYFSRHIQLLNAEFTIATLQEKLNLSNFPILHIATHGVFSSDLAKTFILAYDDSISIPKLDRLLRNRTEGSSHPIDLLVLSACQTAKDDKRGGLGLAGVALQAGAKSTVASLWNISDRSTADFMDEFYQALHSGVTKAEALRQAQLAFIRNPNSQYPERYRNPYYWAAFVLIEN
ncbi:MAG: CHAT domain-containing protein [Cyanobacteriota bacterium]|nr:CHAT domain-containing protein [Cyanobacteriota bacterium]